MAKDTIEHHIRQTDPLSLISEDYLSEPPCTNQEEDDVELTNII